MKNPCVLCGRPTIHRATHIDINAGRAVSIGDPACAAIHRCAARADEASQADHIAGEAFGNLAARGIL